jgi:N6-adenosine-specific RNA methylase IME4
MYDIILADPPWEYNDRRIIRKDGDSSRFGYGACNHYDLMSTEDICRLNVETICNANSALFLWATFPRLPAALQVMQAWGFDYKTIGFAWVKLNRGRYASPRRHLAQEIYAQGVDDFLEWLTFFGVGFYAKHNLEICLLGVKGSMQPVDNSISSVVYSPLGKHSEKPKIVHDKIVQLFGDRPRIELFAREAYKDWHIWGNEVESDIELEVISE